MNEEPELHVDEEGTKRWIMNGEFHRIGAPAIEYSDGGRVWYLHGKVHREDGPAVEWNGGEKWYVNNIRCDDVVAWAKMALQYKNIEPTQEAIDAKIMQVMQLDVFS